MKAKHIIMLLLCQTVLSRAQAQNTGSAEPDTCIHISEIAVSGVTGSAHIREIASPVSIVSSESLRTHQSSNIIDAISRQPGISQIATGSGISKPVIRGLGYNRVLVVDCGIRQEGQQWGDEHGIEVDGQTVNSVEIIKGPASLMYGSDAMAGVIILRDAPIMAPETMYAEAGSEYQANSGLFGYTLAFRGNRSGFVWNWRWSQKLAHDYQGADYGYTPNSGFRERAISGMLGAKKSWGQSLLKLAYYHQTPEMTEAENPYEEGSAKYGIDSPFQEVKHYKAIIDNTINIGSGCLKAIIGYQQNRRQEFEEEDECGLDFQLHTVSYDVRYVYAGANGLKTNFGIGGMFQKSKNLGIEYLIPDYHLLDAGAFATASQSIGNLHLSGGIRYDLRHLSSQELISDGEKRFDEFSPSYGQMSGSIGAILNIGSHLDIKCNASRGYRAPNISELGSNGEHEGTFRYEIGNHELDPEQSWQIDLGADYTSKHLSASLALFANSISNYIFLCRYDGYGTASLAQDPIYRFTASKARILGGEARIVIHPARHLHWESAFSYVDARIIGSGNISGANGTVYLPFTPAPRLLSTLHYDINTRSATFKNLFAEAEADINFRQSHAMDFNLTETPTDGYTLINMSLGTDICSRSGRRLCTICITAANLLNKGYQSHLSRLKYAGEPQSDGRQGFQNIGRSIGLKLLIPVEWGKSLME